MGKAIKVFGDFAQGISAARILLVARSISQAQKEPPATGVTVVGGSNPCAGQRLMPTGIDEYVQSFGNAFLSRASSLAVMAMTVPWRGVKAPLVLVSCTCLKVRRSSLLQNW